MDQERREMPGGPRIEILSRDVMIDQKADIWVRGFKPHSHVEVTTQTVDDNGVAWQSVTPYTLNPQGCLEIAVAESDGESFDDIDPWEIFDSMRPVDDPPEGPPLPLFAKRTTERCGLRYRRRHQTVIRHGAACDCMSLMTQRPSGKRSVRGGRCRAPSSARKAAARFRWWYVSVVRTAGSRTPPGGTAGIPRHCHIHSGLLRGG